MKNTDKPSKPATKKYVIAVDIQLTAPMHITAIEKGAYDFKAQRLSRFDGATGIGCALTRTQSLAHSARVLDSGATFTPQVPVIPASTVAGKLRRAAADLITSSLVKRELTISPNAYNVLSSGMSNTDLKADDKTPEVMLMARNEPFLSLFGGTSFAMSAHSVIAEGWPLLNSTQGFLMTEPITEVQPFAELKEMTEVLPIVRKNDVTEMRANNLLAVVGFENIAAYMEAEAAKRAASKAKKADGEEGKKTDLRAINGVETVKSGVSFGLRVEVTAFAPSHLGLMLLAMQSFLRAGQVGGKGARGYGRFAAIGSRLYEIDANTRSKKVVTSIFGSKDSGYEIGGSDILETAVTAAEDYLDAITPQVLEAFTEADFKTLKQLAKAA